MKKEISLNVKINSTIPEEEIVEMLQYQAEKFGDYFLKDCRTESCRVSVKKSE